METTTEPNGAKRSQMEPDGACLGPSGCFRDLPPGLQFKDLIDFRESRGCLAETAESYGSTNGDFWDLAMIGKNEPKNTSHRPKFPSRRLEQNLRSQTELTRTPWEASRHLPWVTTEKKSSVKRPMRDLRTPSGEVSMAAEIQTRPAQKRHGSNGELCSRLRLVLDTLCCFRGWRLA